VPDLPPGDAERSAQELHLRAEARIALVLDTRVQFGEEPLGLRYAIAAWEKARGTRSEPAMQVAMAVAQFAVGLDQEARRTLETMPVVADLRERELVERLVASLRRELLEWTIPLEYWERELERLTPLVGQRRTYRFPEGAKAEAFLHATLVQFDRDVAAFQFDVVGGVRRRLQWAEFLRRREMDPAFVARAEQALATVRSAEAYRGTVVDFAIADLVDLEPIGIDPGSGLFQFAHLSSAWDGESDPAAIRLPQRDANGRIAVGERTGIVFVLLPGGRVQVGCQNEDPLLPRHDPLRRPDEVLHSLWLDPFLMAAHEVTQWQWACLWTFDEAGKRPSRYFARSADYKAGLITASHPVESIDFLSAERALTSQGLRMPTEVQWEYSCRAGTDGPRSCAREDLVRHANIADAAGKRSGAQWTFESWDDGYVVHAPVGSFAPNAFGLFDMHGNVSEWTSEHYGEYGVERDGDGAREFFYDKDRCYRGGAYLSAADNVRSALREHLSAISRSASLGVRASRPLRIR
jgi:hypothetical protein